MHESQLWVQLQGTCIWWAAPLEGEQKRQVAQQAVLKECLMKQETQLLLTSITHRQSSAKACP